MALNWSIRSSRSAAGPVGPNSATAFLMMRAAWAAPTASAAAAACPARSPVELKKYWVNPPFFTSASSHHSVR